MRLTSIDIERATQSRDALGKPAQSKVSGRRIGSRHADAVIGDCHDDALSI